MSHFLDILFNDLQLAADTNRLAVNFVRWDNARHRLELGELPALQLAEMDAE